MTIKSFSLLAKNRIDQCLQWMNPHRFVGIFIVLGIALRVVQYLYDRSLWLDEACLALNLVEKNFSELIKPLDWGQTAPVGFLFIEKALINAFGDHEYVLRLFPLAAGILSLFLFFEVGRLVLTQQGLVIGLGFFAISAPLLRYSSELKQYSSDVTIALGICLMGLVWLRKESRFIFHTFAFSMIGAILVWFSYPSIFCLTGVGIALALHSLETRNWKQLAWLSFPAFFWLGSFAVLYFVNLLEITQRERFTGLLIGWGPGFMPMPPLSFNDLLWYPKKFFEIFNNPAGFRFIGIAAFCFVIGCTAKFHEKRFFFYILVFPVLITLFLSGLHKYPFSDRLILFLIPTMMIFIAEGVDQILVKTRHTGRIIGWSLCILIFFHPVYTAASSLLKPMEIEEIKPILNYVQQKYRKKDVLFLYVQSYAPFKYYAKRYDLEEVELIRGSSRYDYQSHINDLKILRGKGRVWILFSHVNKRPGIDEEKFILHILDGMGKQVESFKSTGASVYLYDLQPNFPQ